MNRIPYKTRNIIAIVFAILALCSLIVAALVFNANIDRWIWIILTVISIVSFITMIIFIPKTNMDGSPIKIKKKTKIKKYKLKEKEPFMTEREWEEQEEEDDEMMFIEVNVEDD